MGRLGSLRWLMPGVVLAVAEVSLVVATSRQWFLSAGELARYAGFALASLVSITGLSGLCAELLSALTSRGVTWADASHRRRIRRLVFAATLPAVAALLWLLSAGRQLRDLPAREALVALVALVAAAVVAGTAGALVRVRGRGARAVLGGVAWALSVACVAVDMHVLPRLYPAFHGGLFALAVLVALLAAALTLVPRAPGAAAWTQTVLLFLFAAGTAFGGHVLLGSPNTRFAIAQSAPLTADVLGTLGALGLRRKGATLLAVERAPEPEPLVASASQPGIDLRGRDVLLITIDALRADVLRAYGGAGLTPALDTLSAESVVFTRAYTPTPHTSYALASLLTGKFMRPLLELSDAPGEHPTLPELLRHHGYRTAAFFPPAIFFVDQERFAWLRNKQLGFEYVKAMYSPAGDRVAQLKQYLTEVDAGFPVFAWVHLFEPHEPYDPPPEHVRGDSPRARYEGEVAAADAAVAKLVQTFRSLRPMATVIVTSDHGEEFGEHGGYHHGTTLFDEQIRVPLLWSSPGKVEHTTSDVPIELIDVTTTLLAALGIPREARMRGDDFGAVLAGGERPSRQHAFASLAQARMLTDGRHKLICEGEACALFDLREDPLERANLAADRTVVVQSLLTELTAFVATFPRIEALAMEHGGAWPDALVRARLGDRSAAPDIVPLLSSNKPEIRAAAARMLGELGAKAAQPTLARMRVHDKSADVKADAAVAALRVGELEARAQVAELILAGKSGPGVSLLAALALAAVQDATGRSVLLAAARDTKLDETERLAALRALAEVGTREEGPGLVELLPDVRLRSEVARVLGRIGDRSAVEPLVAALENERYPLARRALAEALLRLGARSQAIALLERFLGTESSVPDGVQLLREAGALARAGSLGAELGSAKNVRRGAWECSEGGCRPMAGASIALPGGSGKRGPQRVVVRATAAPGALATLSIAGQGRNVVEGESELSWLLPEPAARPLAVEASEGVLVQALVVVPVRDDVPPPPPEPWQDEPAPAAP